MTSPRPDDDLQEANVAEAGCVLDKFKWMCYVLDPCRQELDLPRFRGQLICWGSRSLLLVPPSWSACLDRFLSLPPPRYRTGIDGRFPPPALRALRIRRGRGLKVKRAAFSNMLPSPRVRTARFEVVVAHRTRCGFEPTS